MLTYKKSCGLFVEESRLSFVLHVIVHVHIFWYHNVHSESFIIGFLYFVQRDCAISRHTIQRFMIHV